MKVVTYVCNHCGIEIEKGRKVCDKCYTKNKLKTAKEYYIRNKARISIKNKDYWKKIKKDPKLHRRYLNHIKKWQEKNKEKLRIKQRENYQNKEKFERSKFREDITNGLYNKLKHEVLKI